MIADLFDPPLVPGLDTRADIISAEEEAALSQDWCRGPQPFLVPAMDQQAPDPVVRLEL